MLRVGCIGFGGGSALIPILHKTYVEEEKVMDETEYEEAVVISSITPGALTIKLAGEIGRRVAGWKGMLVGASAMALPGVFLTTILLSFITNLSQGFVQQMEFLTVGVMAYIACMLTDYIWKTIQQRESGARGCLSIGITVTVFLLTCGKTLYRLLGLDVTEAFYLSTLDVFLAIFVVIFIKSAFSKYRERHTAKSLKWEALVKEIGIMLVAVVVTLIPAMFVTKEALSYSINGVLSSMMSFGGGDAYLTVADGLFVSTELVTEDAFYGTIIPLVNLLPGSILCKALSGIGFWIGYTESGQLLGGYIVAMLGFTCSFAASCGIVSIVGGLYRSFGEMPIFQAVKQWIRPVVSGLMLNVILSLVYQSRETGVANNTGWTMVFVMLLIYGVNLFLHYRKKSNNVKMVIMSVVVSLILCNVITIL